MTKIVLRCMTMVVALSLGWSVPASGEQYFTNAGGPWAWDDATANWAATSGGPYDAAWASGEAVFEGAAGSVFVGAVSASALTFNIAGYVLTNGTLTLTGPTVVANSGAIIHSAIAGSA
jgi:hypothetical protein